MNCKLFEILLRNYVNMYVRDSINYTPLMFICSVFNLDESYPPYMKMFKMILAADYDYNRDVKHFRVKGMVSTIEQFLNSSEYMEVKTKYFNHQQQIY